MGVPAISQAILDHIHDEIGSGEFVGGNLIFYLGDEGRLIVYLASWDKDILTFKSKDSIASHIKIFPLTDPDFKKVITYIKEQCGALLG